MNDIYYFYPNGILKTNIYKLVRIIFSMNFNSGEYKC